MTYEREPNPVTKRPLPLVPAIIAVVAVIAAAIWYMQRDTDSPTPIAAQPPTAVEPATPAFPKAVEDAPDIPQVEETFDMEEEPAQELPPLTDSDEFARNVLAPLSQEEDFALWLQTENLLQKAVAFVDGLSKGNLLKKIIPVQPPQGKFNVIKEEDRIWLDEANYQRYDDLTDLFTSISPQALSQVFHTLRPLLESAYGDLGYPADKFDNSLIAAIDQVLAAPEIDSAIALKSESVAYQFADPALESLPAIQKQMVRMGPANTAKIKAHLRQVRQALLAESADKNMDEHIEAD